MQGGGFAVSGNATLTDLGKGVLIYKDATGCDNDGISFSGNGRVQLSALSSGIYQGLTIFQSRSSTADVSVTGNGNLTITGAIYAVSASVQIAGNGGTDVKGTPLDTFGSLLIAADLTLSGNGSISVG
jgi:hypothetical protein